jgi:hypothetical protein
MRADKETLDDLKELIFSFEKIEVRSEVLIEKFDETLHKSNHIDDTTKLKRLLLLVVSLFGIMSLFIFIFIFILKSIFSLEFMVLPNSKIIDDGKYIKVEKLMFDSVQTNTQNDKYYYFKK